MKAFGGKVGNLLSFSSRGWRSWYPSLRQPLTTLESRASIFPCLTSLRSSHTNESRTTWELGQSRHCLILLVIHGCVRSCLEAGWGNWKDKGTLPLPYINMQYIGGQSGGICMKHKFLIKNIIPALILFSLWLDGWFFPLILLPVIYVVFVEKKSLSWLGFSRHEIVFSLVIGVLIAFVFSWIYYPIFLYYLPTIQMEIITLYGIFLDVVWYPIYEEITYRSFGLLHFSKLDESYLSHRNLIVNIFQSLLFLSIHKHHFGVPLVLLPVFCLAFMNGLLFLKTRNINGCIASHSAMNGFALLLRLLMQVA